MHTVSYGVTYLLNIVIFNKLFLFFFLYKSISNIVNYRKVKKKGFKQKSIHPPKKITSLYSFSQFSGKLLRNSINDFYAR